VLLVVFFLAERCRQPLATLRERLHLSARATLLLHFVLELAFRLMDILGQTVSVIRYITTE
ncbi:hypothetical protein, partial [Prevotella corporis]|uniref:hypothetical protein n=1 Tax=Prevotella corporis TaxID=28128 RepID=UPI0027E4F4EC